MYRKDQVMNDSPSLEEAVEQASEAISTTSDVPTDTHEEPKPTEETQSDPDKDGDEKTPVDDLVSPDDLPEELKPIYEKMKKDMDKGFTQGRQKDREELNSLKKELAEIRKNTTQEPDWENLTPEQQVEKLAEQKVLEAKLNDFRQTALDDYNGIDSRLNNSEGNESYDKLMDTAISTQLDKLLDEHISIYGNELGFDYKSHAKDLIEQWDNYLQTNIDRFVSKQKEAAKKAESKMQKSNPQSSKTSEVKPNSSMSLEDAVSAAFSRVSGK